MASATPGRSRSPAPATRSMSSTGRTARIGRPRTPRSTATRPAWSGCGLFPNPEFDGAAKRRWDPNLYYTDTAEGRRYGRDPYTIRPFRVGMSCGYCHIAPHPLKPPADPEFPRWENLSNNIGNQFLRMRVAFGNTLEPENYLYHVFDSIPPRAVDTSAHPSDNNNNPNTVNSFFGLRGRLERAAVTPKELMSPDSFSLRPGLHRREG